jgi:hypothetical protein
MLGLALALLRCNITADAGDGASSLAPVFLEIGSMDLLNDTLRIWAMQREFRAVLADLRGRSDRELAKMGLARGDIARVAWEEAERRILGPAPARRNPLPVLGRYRQAARARTAAVA